MLRVRESVKQTTYRRRMGASLRGAPHWIAEQCRGLGDDVIVAGDLSATLDRLGALPECSDTALMTLMAASGTWPSSTPQALAPPIDHVLIGSGWNGREVPVDHRDEPPSGSHEPQFRS